MSKSVKSLFRILIKVPIIILITYFIFNIFAFSFTYFRLLGVSYVVMQTAVENNFIPPSESSTLINYLDSLETGIVSNITLGCDTDNSNDTSGGVSIDVNQPNSDNRKVQYGTPITVTVSAKYNWIFPLARTNDDGKADANGVEYSEDNDNNIKISHTVPGLKYYPDIS